jgi:hypothetical protein
MKSSVVKFTNKASSSLKRREQIESDFGKALKALGILNYDSPITSNRLLPNWHRPQSWGDSQAIS